jgi:XTP/dITP diphosphohydrolase
MNIWFATGNIHKKGELSAILGGKNGFSGPKLLIPADAGLDFDPLETGNSFHENALLKAMALYSLLKNGQKVWQEGDAIIADDSGLCVDSLGGRPGIFSARYAGKAHEYAGKAYGYAGENDGVTAHGEKKLESAQRNALLLEELSDTAGRSARFVCAMVLLFSPDRYFLAQETFEGEIVKGPEFARGTGGFGYDPILYLPEMGKTVAELSEEEKNKISHRGKAAKLIAGILGKK